MPSTAEALAERYLKFGIFLAPFHPLEENPMLCLQRDMELLEHIDGLGYDEAWVGEHHSGGFEIIANPELFIAQAIERTRHIRLGTGVISLPYHNPFAVASRMTQLDYQARGRAMFGVGPGALVGDAFRMGIDPENQRRMLNEALDAIVPLMRGESVTMETDWFNLREARLQLSGYTRPHMEMAVASARSPVGALAAGKHGLGMLSIGGTSDDALKAHASNWGVAETSAAENGKSMDRKNWRIVTLMHVAETRDKAFENVRWGIERWARYFREIATFPIVPSDITDAAEYLTDNKMAVIGSPDDAIEYLENLWDGAGGFGCLMQLAHNWADWSETKRSYELIARQVIPHFQNSNRLRQISYDYSFENRPMFIGKAEKAITNEIEKFAAESDDAAE
jgi:limonene 1,2-monooxygenase